MARPKKISRLFAAARQADRRLSTWMRQHHDVLIAELGTTRVDWRRALPVISQLGLTDEVGQSLTRDTASRTWKRVREAVEAQRYAVTAAVSRLAPDEIAPGIRRVALTSISQPDTLDARPVALRDTGGRVVAPMVLAPAPVLPVAATPAPSETPEVMEATEQIRAVLTAMGALRVPLPSRTS